MSAIGISGFKEEAELLISGKPTAKTRPMATSGWFATAAEDILKQVAEAENLVGEKRGKEFDSTVVDLKPVTIARAGAPIKVAAFVRDPSGIASVRLRHRGVTQFDDGDLAHWNTSPMDGRLANAVGVQSPSVAIR